MRLAAASGVSRASNKDIPLIGTCIRAFQNIYVERAGEGGNKKEKKNSSSSSSTPSSSSSGVTAAIQARVRGDPNWPNLILAPEGTCGDGNGGIAGRGGGGGGGSCVCVVSLRVRARGMGWWA